MAPLRYPLKTSTDITIKIPTERQTICEICNKECSSANSLAGHIGAKHRVKFEDYLVQYYNNNIRPLCPVCNKSTRYLRGEYSFKKYCVEHADESRKEWSLQKGFGKNEFDHAWRSGQTKETNEWVAKQAATITGKNNPSFLSEQSFSIKLSYLLENNIQINISYNEYYGDETPVECKCVVCKRKTIKKFGNAINNPSCPSCTNGKSREEQEVYNYILQICPDAVRGDRKTVGKELDIYIPSIKFAIEYNGLFWHTEDKIGKSYHSDKSLACNNNNIKLFHIFSDEWNNKQEIVKSMLEYRLKATKNVVYARKCTIHTTNLNSDLESFFDQTHISGHTQFIKAFYLKHGDEIVCALSLRKSHHKKYDEKIEIARFCNRLNTNVVGGFSKLLSQVKKWAFESGYKGIFSYADLRFGSGSVYELNGFKLVDKTKLDYWYTNGKQRYNRFQYRAQPGKSEKQVAEEAGVQKIYGCGSNIYEMIF